MERKLATVVFVDLVDSTGLVAASDPEVVRRRMTRYFDQVSRCIELHGGTVEKFAGDAVMAAFGVPQAHEDDAERAVRASFAVLDSVRELGLEARIGIESGEVVVEDTESTFATGEAVNLAARLQQSAERGTILLGTVARRLAGGAVEVEEAVPVELSGWTEPVRTWRALRVVEGRLLPSATPFVGREPELELLRNTYARAVRDRRAHLVTVFGEPGIGKSRLLAEFLAATERVTVLTGRALPYGEGVTYWPLASMVKESAGIADDDDANEAFEKLRLCCESEAVADLLAVALGLLGAAGGERTSEDVTWAALRWAEQLADGQPLVLVFEDVHWADDRLLDLIEHLARSLRASAALLVCVARPELLETRPGWAGGNTRATAIELGPLGDSEGEELANALLARADLAPARRALLLDKAEGNPLFLEETARMLAEGGVDGVTDARIPDSIQAVVAARIDRLPPGPKHLLQSASVMGRTFWAGAVRSHASGDGNVDGALATLLEREFVEPVERSTISDERELQFTHGLIRDVAYTGTSKESRAREHRQFADWLAERAPVELAEIRAYHLDQAVLLTAELEGAVPAELLAEAAAALEEAGQRALRQDALSAARRLLLRAVEVEPTLERRYAAALAAARMHDYSTVAQEMERVRDEARASDDRALHGRALTVLSSVELHTHGDAAAVLDLARQALVLLPEGDAEGRFRATLALYDGAWFPGDLEAAEGYARAALGIAERAGRDDLSLDAIGRLGWIAEMRLDLPRAEDYVERQRVLAEASGSIVAAAAARTSLGALRRLQGRLEEADAAYEEARRLHEQIGDERSRAWAGVYQAWVAWIGGDGARAERLLREGIRVFTSVGDRSRLCEAQRALAELELERGRTEEAERLALAARDTVSAHDFTSVGTTTMTLGLVRAGQGRHAEAEALLREAVAVHDGRGFTALALEPRTALIEFLARHGKDEEARSLAATLPDHVAGWLGRADARSAVLIA